MPNHTDQYLTVNIPKAMREEVKAYFDKVDLALQAVQAGAKVSKSATVCRWIREGMSRDSKLAARKASSGA